jgi:type II secretory pathway component GspD/PulD (secretin)
MRSLAGWLVLLGGLGLTGCTALQQKGDLGAAFLENDANAPEVADAARSSALDGWLSTENAKAKTVEVSEVKPTEVAMPAAPAVVEKTQSADVVNVDAAPKAGETASVPAAPVADPPAPTPPAPVVVAPAEETPEQRAERLLRESRQLTSVEDQARMAEAAFEFETGVKLFNSLSYVEAQKHFARSAELDPTNMAAQDYLRKCGGMLGIRKDHFQERLAQLEQQDRVRVQEQVVVLTTAIEEGRKAEERGEQIDLSVADSGKEQILADQLDSLRQAELRYRRVKEILNYMPPNFDMPNERRVVDEGIQRVRGKIAAKEEEIAFLRRQDAARIAEEQGLRETLLFKQRIQKLLEEVDGLYRRGEYRSSEKLAIRVLQLDPLNHDAESWKRKARAAQHDVEFVTTKETHKEAVTQTWEMGEFNHIPYGDLLVYPSNWDEICKRPERMAIGAKVSEEQWKLDIRKRLQRKVSFEFVDTPLQEAISFLRSLTNVTMIVDPKVLEAGPPAINLRVTDMSLDLALGWILRLADLDYAFKDKAIFISRKNALVEDVELRIYDVSDLTLTIQDMPGPDLQVQTADPTDAGAGGAANNPFLQAADTAVVTPANIADMIRAHVRPDTWDPAQGTSIEERSGRLVVMQRPEVHQLINQLLDNFRATQKIMVNVEGRFLLIRESNAEEIGVEWSGLDQAVTSGSHLPKGLNGDFGDIGGALGGTPPVPGFTKTPTNLNNAAFGTVGAITTGSGMRNYSDDIDTIGSTIGASGGLNMQLSVLSDPQYQAFLHATAGRESVSVLLTPRLTVYNTQRAHMFVANQYNYVSDYEVSGDAFDPLVRQFLAGVVLDVRPTVSSDRRYVTMEIRPAQVTFDSMRIRYMRQVVPVGTDGNGNAQVAALTLPIEFPNLSIRRVRTTVTVPDGGILLLAGLYRNVKFTNENGVPFLSDLPVVGRLFRWNVDEKARSNLAILVSPKIILFQELEAGL